MWKVKSTKAVLPMSQTKVTVYYCDRVICKSVAEDSSKYFLVYHNTGIMAWQCYQGLSYDDRDFSIPLFNVHDVFGLNNILEKAISILMQLCFWFALSSYCYWSIYTQFLLNGQEIRHLDWSEE